MKLHWSPRSPFVRKVMIALHELDMVDKVELVRSVAAFAAAPNPQILADNPLGKIPALVTDNLKLFDSRVICEYLDQSEHRLLPEALRFQHLRWQALGDGLTDILLLWRIERAREGKADPVILSAFETKTRATLAALDAEAGALSAAPFGLGHIAIVCALGQLDFRYAGCGWQKALPRLAAWQAAQLERPSVAATAIDDDGAGPAGPDTPAFSYEVQ